MKKVPIEINERENIQDNFIDTYHFSLRQIHGNEKRFLTEIYTCMVMGNVDIFSQFGSQSKYLTTEFFNIIILSCLLQCKTLGNIIFY